MSYSDEASIQKYRNLLVKVQETTPDATFFIKSLKGSITQLEVMQTGRKCSEEWLKSNK
jgi:hypothetical protein